MPDEQTNPRRTTFTDEDRARVKAMAERLHRYTGKQDDDADAIDSLLAHVEELEARARRAFGVLNNPSIPEDRARVKARSILRPALTATTELPKPGRSEAIRKVRPDVTEFEGRWLALSPDGAPIRCATIGNSRADAERQFEEAKSEWARLAATE